MIYVDLDHSKISTELFRQFPLLKQTLSLIKVAHNGQTYNNLPYWHHPVRVMLRLGWYSVDADDIYSALLHDTVEDTAVTIGDLRNFGYSEATINTVSALTRNPDEETYKEYVHGLISIGNVKILRLKLADLYENSNNVRFLPPEKRKVLVRYGKSINDIRLAMEKHYSSSYGISLLENTISGELDRTEVEKWIGEQPTFV
jgi:(p)ppGpp synthase/HD superfamily hydrolase